MACQINYVSYVYSIASERNLHVIFVRLFDTLLVNLVQNAMTSTCLFFYFINIHALAIGV